MANIITNKFLYNCLAAFAGHTVKAAILADTYTPDKDHNTWADVSSNEISSAGYVAGGQELANLAATEDDAGDKAFLDCDDLSWSGITLTDARYLVLYDTSDSDNIIAVYDFGTNQAITAGNFTVSINALGLLSLAQV
jgi:hypothetical protein